ncbi:TadE family protein [Georgenia thermotolerans]|uniref:Pilus assembly protein n=1 Tax=Georgenia thermotolerans TaxID=527326 RepID=A0A7J5USD0_9MICO|nr:TadE/TadG family type IV pilus assembly protein [Georgenia thermotolerans]KAE8765365.1 pilus assembly protein [Georgenia thermotolerans]
MRRLRRWYTRDGPGERGSASVEASIGVPAFMLFIGLIIFAGRVAVTHQTVQTAADAAARSASLARTAAEAGASAQQAAEVSLANQALKCAAVDVSVDTSAFATAIGTASEVAVTVVCHVDLADVSVPGVPGSHAVRATMSSPLDVWRTRQ